MDDKALQLRIDALIAEGWEAETQYGEDIHTVFEAFVHELAHCQVLGDLSVHNMGEIAQLIQDKTPDTQGDLDEILVTAITIQMCEQHYGVTQITETALSNLPHNIRFDLELRKVAQDLVIEHIGSQLVREHCAAIFAYIESSIGYLSIR
jgi:hypothetical protein